MIAWYNALSSLEQSFALVAIGATTFLFLQTGMMLFGLGMHAASDSFEGSAHDILDGQSDIDSYELADDFEADSPDLDSLDLDNPDFDAPDAPDSDYADFEADGETSDGEIGENSEADSSSAYTYEPSLRLFTVRGIVAFFALAGWSGLVALQSQWDLPAVLGAAFVAGAMGCYAIAKIMQIFLRLQDSGNIQLENAIGLEGETYLRIPATLAGRGKITLILQERYVEIEAVTRETSDLSPGQKVHIVGIYEDDAVIVRSKE